MIIEISVLTEYFLYQNQAINKLSSAVSQYQRWFMLASQEIEQLRSDLQELEKGLNCSDATLQLRTEVTNLKNKVHECYPSVIDVESSPYFHCPVFLKSALILSCLSSGLFH